MFGRAPLNARGSRRGGECAAARRVAPLLLLLLPAALRAQVGVSPPQGAPPDTARATREALSDARDAQGRFERLRRQWSPARPYAWLGSDCDERIGRICLRYDEGGDWWPETEDSRITSARGELLDALAEAAILRPGDEWLLGQRILYLVEGGFPEEAEGLARGCADARPATCAALLGLALHVQGLYVDSERAFDAALRAMDDAERRRWMDPAVLLDPAGRRLLEDMEAGGPLSHAEAVSRAWRLADPLYLVDGNDRLTEHWSRLTVSRHRDDAQNPYRLRWGRDLEEVLVRYGWEAGWDRALDLRGGLADGVIGHHHPESRVYLPPGRVLEHPGAAAPEAWTLSPTRPPDGYAPAYAPVIVPAPGDLLRFPRGDRFAVVATYAVPEDTTHHARHEHAAPAQVRAQQGLPPRAGLFLLPLRGGEVVRTTASGAGDGVFLLEAPAGEYLASTEVWLPDRGFAGRRRQGVRSAATPLDVPTLSDLILLRSALPDSARLETALGAVRAPTPIAPGEALGVGWELHGLGWREEVLSYHVSVARAGVGFFSRLGGWLGLTDPEAPLRLSWEEPGPPAPGPSFRTTTVQIPDLASGDYVLRLEVHTGSGAILASERPLRIDGR